jgi:hypothetical protein
LERKKIISKRAIEESARVAINEIHGDPIWAYVEMVLNAFTAMRKNDTYHRTVCITLKGAKEGQDVYCIDTGTGITNYTWIEQHLGYTSDEEYITNQKDPDYLNKMGYGIPSIANLSKDGIAEFRSIFINTKGQEEGLVATYNVKEEGGGFEMPADHPDSKYVFVVEGVTAPMKTGTWVIVKNAKQFTLTKVINLLSDIFSRKLRAAGYTIQIREKMSDDFIVVQPTNTFCGKHEKTIGYVNDPILGDCRVYADIHPVTKTEDADVKILVKKAKYGIFESEFMAKGHAGCDYLDITPDREGVKVDEYNKKYAQYCNVVLQHYAELGIEKKPTQEMKNRKLEKRWSSKMNEVCLKYFLKNRDHHLLDINAVGNPNGLTSKLQQHQLVPRPKIGRPERRCLNGFHWSKKAGKCVENTEKVEHPKPGPILNPRGPNDPHIPRIKPRGRNGGRKRKLTDEFTEQSQPDFRTIRRPDATKFCVYISEAESALVFNSFYAWVDRIVERASDDIMELLCNIALVNAVRDNKGIPTDEFLRRVAQQL